MTFPYFPYSKCRHLATAMTSYQIQNGNLQTSEVKVHSYLVNALKFCNMIFTENILKLSKNNNMKDGIGMNLDVRKTNHLQRYTL
jgi:hypothetical protein